MERETLKEQVSQLKIQLAVKEEQVVKSIEPVNEFLTCHFDHVKKEIEEMKKDKSLMDQIALEKKSLEDKLFEKESEIVKLTEKCDFLANEMNRLKQEVETITNDHQYSLTLVESLKKQIVEQGDKMASNQNFYQQKENENTLYKSEIQRITSRLCESKQVQQETQSQVDTLQSRLIQLKQENDTMNSKFVMERSEYYVKMNEKEEDCKYMSKILSDLEQSHQILYEKHTNCQLELHNTLCHLNQMESIKDQMQQEVNELGSNLETRNQQVYEMNQVIAHLNQKLSLLEEQVDSLKHQLESSQEARLQLESLLKETMIQNENLKINIESLESHQNALQTQLVKMEQDLDSSQQAHVATRDVLAMSKQDVASLEETIIDLQTQNKHVVEEMERIKHVSLESNKRETNQEIQSLVKSMEEMKNLFSKQMESKNIKLMEMQQVLVQKESEFKELMNQGSMEIEQLGSKINQLRSQRNEYLANYQTEIQSKREALDTIQKVESRIVLLEEALTTCKSENKVLMESNQSNTSRVETYKKQMESITASLDEEKSKRDQYWNEIQSKNESITSLMESLASQKKDFSKREMELQLALEESKETNMKWSRNHELVKEQVSEMVQECTKYKQCLLEMQMTCEKMKQEHLDLNNKWLEESRMHEETKSTLNQVNRDLEREKTDYTTRPIFSNQLAKERSIANQYKQRVTLLESCLLNQDTTSTLDDFSPETYISTLMARSREINSKRDAERNEDKKKVIELRRENIETKQSLMEMAKIINDQKITLKQQEENLMQVKTKYTSLKRKVEESSSSRKKKKEDEKPMENGTSVPPLKKASSGLMKLLDQEDGFKLKKLNLFQSNKDL